MKLEAMKNDRAKQFAIHIKADDERPYDEYLVLPAQTAEDYRRNLRPEYREWLLNNWTRHVYAELVVNGQVEDVQRVRPRCYGLKRTGWVNVGNEAWLEADGPINGELIL